MTYDLVDDLRHEISQGHVLVVVGSGVSIGATGGDPRTSVASWTGLLEDGVKRCLAVKGLTEDWAEGIRADIRSKDLDRILSAAETVFMTLSIPDPGPFKRWLRQSVGSLKVSNRSVVEAIRDLGLPIATTNYDNLLEELTGFPPVTWLDSDRVIRVVRRQEPGIIHFHGHWNEPDSIVLGTSSYERILGHPHAQEVLRSLMTLHALVFIGCGDGLSDPNFAQLLRWAKGVFAGTETQHYRLCKDDEYKELRARHGDDHLHPIAYGPEHSCLTEFLESLGSFASKDGGPAVPALRLPPPSPCFGREDEVRDLVDTLLQATPPPTPILGGPGVGKTTVTLAALHESQVVARYGARRFFVRCDSAKSREVLIGEIARTIILKPGPDIEASLFAALGSAPAVLVLDNAETPWDGPDKAAVSELLADLGGIGGLALVASVRGSERPWGPTWRRSIQVGPLELPAAREAFLDKADDERFAVDLDLDPLLKEVGRLALAVVLLGHQAQGVANLAELRREWQAQKTALLRRDRGQHRLENIEASLELSISGHRMTAEARRLLSVLGLLPDGIDRENLDVLLPDHGGTASMVLRKVGLAFDQGTRLRVLAPVREYVRREYPPKDEDLSRVVEHYLDLAREGDRAGKEGGAEAVAKLVNEIGNVEAMILVSLESAEPKPAIRAARSLGWFTAVTGWGSSTVLLRAAEVSHRADKAKLQAACLERLGDIALYRSDHDTARERYEEALPLYRRVGDILGEANCIRRLGEIALRCSSHDTARERYEEALPLYRRVDNVLGEASCIRNLGDIAFRCSDHDTARERYEEALPLYRLVDGVLGEANCILGLGDIALERSDHTTARERYEEALPIYRLIGASLGEANCNLRLGDIALECSDHDTAHERYEKALPIYRLVGDILGEANCIQSLGDMALSRSDHDSARARFMEALDLYKKIREPYSTGWVNVWLARLSVESDDRQTHIRAARTAWESIKRPDLMEILREEFGEVSEESP